MNIRENNEIVKRYALSLLKEVDGTQLPTTDYHVIATYGSGPNHPSGQVKYRGLLSKLQKTSLRSDPEMSMMNGLPSEDEENYNKLPNGIILCGEEYIWVFIPTTLNVDINNVIDNINKIEDKGWIDTQSNPNFDFWSEVIRYLSSL